MRGSQTGNAIWQDLVDEFETKDEKAMPDVTPESFTTPTTQETDAQRIARLESELKAAGRVNYLLQEASTKVVTNNEHLRTCILSAIVDLAMSQSVEPSRKLSDTAKGLDALMNLPGTLAGLASGLEKSQ
jgi:hypothetical protein